MARKRPRIVPLRLAVIRRHRRQVEARREQAIRNLLRFGGAGAIDDYLPDADPDWTVIYDQRSGR